MSANTKVVPSGLRYFPEIISVREEKDIIEWAVKIGSGKWQQDRMRGQVTRRKYISFGWAYKLYSRTLIQAGRIPSVLKDIRALCSVHAEASAKAFDQMVLIKYPIGAGIGAHTDAPCFGPVVLGLSLGTSCQMLFTHSNLRDFKLLLEPRSLLVLSGESRFSWTHEIASLRRERMAVIIRSRMQSVGESRVNQVAGD